MHRKVYGESDLDPTCSGTPSEQRPSNCRKGQSSIFNVRCPAPGCYFVLEGRHVMTPNRLAERQAASLLARCRCGVRYSFADNGWVQDDRGCPVRAALCLSKGINTCVQSVVRLSDMPAHERVCIFAPATCPNRGCGLVMKRCVSPVSREHVCLSMGNGQRRSCAARSAAVHSRAVSVCRIGLSVLQHARCGRCVRWC